MLIHLYNLLKEVTIEHPTLGEVTLCPEIPLQYQSGAWAIAAEKACSECNLGNTCNDKCEFYKFSLMHQLKGD